MMSHSVRRLWTGAIMVMMGCQSVPSAFTSFDDAFDRPSAERPAASPPRASLFPLNDAEEVETFVNREIPSVASVSSRAGTPARAEQSLHRPINTDNHRSALFSIGSTTRTAANEAPQTARSDDPPAQSTGATQPQETSIFQSMRTRLFGAEADDTVARGETLPPNSESHFSEDLFAESAPRMTPPIQQVGHPGSSSESRRVMRILDQPLEAPTPFSALARRTAAVDPAARDDVAPPAEPSPTDGAANDENETGSLFDVFGIGGDRAGGEQGGDTAVLRRATTARLQRPPAADASREPEPSIEELKSSLNTVHWQEELDRLTTLLETQLALQTPGESNLEEDYYIRQHVALRLLYLIGSRRPEALQAIPHCDPDRQEFWTEMLWALSNIFDDEAMPERAERARETAKRLEAALKLIAPHAGLELAETRFCRQISGFGNYVAFDENEFSAGQDVLIYTEVNHFTSEPADEGFLTTLQSTLRIHRGDVTGPIVFEEQLPATDDFSRSRRHDYFHSYRITLPANLTPGPHVLTVTMRDENSHTLDTTSLTFKVR